MKCEQCKWKKVNEAPIHSWGIYGKYIGITTKEILYQCQKCGRLQKVRLGN